MFLTLIETLSKIHSSAATAPKYRVMFILSEGGNLLNFQGVKKWLDSHWEENSAVQVGHEQTSRVPTHLINTVSNFHRIQSLYCASTL